VLVDSTGPVAWHQNNWTSCLLFAALWSIHRSMTTLDHIEHTINSVNPHAFESSLIGFPLFSQWLSPEELLSDCRPDGQSGRLWHWPLQIQGTRELSILFSFKWNQGDFVLLSGDRRKWHLYVCCYNSFSLGSLTYNPFHNAEPSWTESLHIHQVSKDVKASTVQ
jgi:hypothetical protein